MSQSEGTLFIPCCPEEGVASLCSPVQFCTVTYPPELKSDAAKKQFKHKLLKEKPGTLFADLHKTGEGICNGWKIKIKDPTNMETIMTTVNIYKNGTLMVQGNLGEFQESFNNLREIAEKERSNENTPKGEGAECASTHSSTVEPSAQEQDQDPSLYTSITLIKEHFTRLEVELVHLREMVLKQEQDKELKHERDTYRKELAELKEQQQSPLKADTSTQTNPSTQLQPIPSTSTSTSSQKPPPPSTPTSSQQSTPSQQVHPETSAQDTNRAERRTTDHLDIALLIDSNGKFIDQKKLFPRHRVAKLWCLSPRKALELLTEAKLGSQSHIIIHTGTNDLRAQQERVAISLRAVIEKASNTFPNSKIIISTLLPRKDFYPYTIQKINGSIARECALKHPPRPPPNSGYSLPL
ncbi:hypothetical protein MHYP_G00335160 [Metynnis hypsauchen]